MGNRIFIAVVVLLWSTTMAWLLIAKILPPFYYGEPPKQDLLQRDEPVCWQVESAGRPLGFAVSQAVPGASGTTEIHSRVVLDNLPIREMAPQWMSLLVQRLGSIRLDTRTRVTLDSLGSMASFDSRVRINDLPTVIKMLGHVADGNLVLQFNAGERNHKMSIPVSARALFGGELLPEQKLLQLHVGRKWQKEVFSPFRSPNQPLELIQAEVMEEVMFLHDGQLVNTKRVEFRRLSAAGVAVNNGLAAMLWVADDGTVLRQDAYLLNVKLRFERRRDRATIRRGKELLDLDTVATLSVPVQKNQHGDP